MRSGPAVAALIGFLAGARAQAALDVTGHWDTLPFSPNIVQSASHDPYLDDIAFCAPGLGPIGTGTVNVSTGTFNVTFDIVRLFQMGYPVACHWRWTGTFAPDGASFTGTVVFAPLELPVPPPPQLPTCGVPVLGPIEGTRLGPPVPCCGNGAVEPGEACDPGRVLGGCCNGITCAPEPVGGECDSDFQVCTADVCDGEGACVHVPTTAACNAGPCLTGACVAGACAPAAPLPAGTFCQTDDDLCTQESCDGQGACVAGAPVDCGPCITCEPLAGCLGPRRPPTCDELDASSSLELVDGPSDADDRLFWRWRKDHDRTVLADFGDPLGDTAYEFCVYSTLLFGGESLAQRARIVGDCDGESCWRALRHGFAFEGASGGIDTVRLRSARRGRTRLRVDGRGEGLGLHGPLTGLSDVSVDLVARDAAGTRCWRARYAHPSVHTPTRFRAGE